MNIRYRVRNKVYFRIAMILISVIEMVILLAFGFFFFNMKSYMIDQLYKIYVEDVKKEITATQDIIDLIDNTSIQVKYDYYVQLLGSYNKPDPTQFIPALQQITNYRRAVNLIDSIYIYNFQTFYISDETAPNFIQPKEGFADKSIIPIIDNYRSYSIFKPIPRKITILGTGKEVEGCSFLLYDKVSIGPRYIVIINLTNDWLKNIIQRTKQIGSTKNLILDERGRVIASDGDEKFLSILDDDYAKEITSKTPNSGYIIKTINNEKSSIIYAKMPSLNWTFISVIPYKLVSKNISRTLERVLITCLIILFLGAIIAIYMSRKLYDPVRNILNKLSKYESEQLIISNERKKKFLLDFVLHSEEFAESFIQKCFQEYNINITLKSSYILILMKIDRNKLLKSNDEKNNIKFVIENIILELLQSKYLIYSSDVSETEMLFIINGKIDYTSDKEYITNKINEAQKLINSYFHASFSAIISNEIIVYKNLHHVFEELRRGLKNTFFYGDGSIIFYDDIKGRSDVKYFYPENKVKEIIAALITGKSDRSMSIYIEIMNELRKCDYEVFQIYSSFLFLEISQGIKNAKVLAKNDWVEKLEAIVTEFGSFETLGDFNEAVFKIFDGIADSYKNFSSSKYDNIVKKIVKIVETRYGDMNLSVDSIADNIGLTASYVTKIFKQHTGKTVIEYINEKRIEMAKLLLRETTDSISVIAEKCGFANVTYFHRSFKKVVGITPNQYRCNNRLTLSDFKE
ncbi:AraC-like DNA-binding protein [Thermohydrogenium kirishiense]|nr:AraC-like DNA-binding protein [Thermohydrogenium kirishiense]